MKRERAGEGDSVSHGQVFQTQMRLYAILSCSHIQQAGIQPPLPNPVTLKFIIVQPHPACGRRQGPDSLRIDGWSASEAGDRR